MGYFSLYIQPTRKLKRKAARRAHSMTSNGLGGKSLANQGEAFRFTLRLMGSFAITDDWTFKVRWFFFVFVFKARFMFKCGTVANRGIDSSNVNTVTCSCVRAFKWCWNLFGCKAVVLLRYSQPIYIWYYNGFSIIGCTIRMRWGFGPNGGGGRRGYTNVQWKIVRLLPFCLL